MNFRKHLHKIGEPGQEGRAHMLVDTSKYTWAICGEMAGMTLKTDMKGEIDIYVPKALSKWKLLYVVKHTLYKQNRKVK